MIFLSSKKINLIKYLFSSKSKTVLILTALLMPGCFSPTKPQVAEYVECRKHAHEAYLKVNKRMQVANALDYGLFLNTNGYYYEGIKTIFADKAVSQRLVDEIKNLPCFAKKPNYDESIWLKDYEKLEVLAEIDFKNKSYIPVMKEIIANHEKNYKRHLFQEIGTRICKNDNEIRYTGFIERIETSKIQIRVSNAEFIGLPKLSPGSFEPSIIWDFPENWYVCE